MKHLILGGIRSGKSRFAEELAIQTELPITYIATATANDDEMKRRIQQHKDRRPESWKIIEEPIKLTQALLDHSNNNHCLIVDCLTLWLTNCLMLNDENHFQHERKILLQCLPTLTGKTIFVSNEINMGIIPMGELTRRYVDEAGMLHQEMARRCEQVTLTVAGLPVTIKGENHLGLVNHAP